MKWLICKVIPDSSVIGGMIIYRTIDPTQLFLLSKLSDYSVMYSWTGTDDTKINLFISDVIQDLLSLQEISHNIQDYSHNGTTHAVQMKWVLCDVISLHHWSERQEILSCCRSDRVFDGGIHQRRLLLANMKWLICDVISHSHFIAGRQNRISNPREWIFPSK